MMKSMKGEIGRVEKVGMRRVALFKTKGQTQKQERLVRAGGCFLSRSSFDCVMGCPAVAQSRIFVGGDGGLGSL